MEVKNWTYDEFPDYTGTPLGAKRIATSGEEILTVYLKDVEYAVVDGVHLHLQILKPSVRNDAERKYPCMVYVQGSAWGEQNVYMGVCSLANIVKRGFVVAVVQYRHSGQAPFPAQIQDAKNAIRFLRKNADEFNIMSEKMIAAGSSSGGHTAVFCGLVGDGEEFDNNLFPGISAEVCGIVDYYGAVTLMMEDGNPTTINHKLPDSPEGRLMRANLREHPDIASKGTCVTYITSDTKIPPVLIFHGTKDMVVNCRESVELYEKLKMCGKDAELYLIEGANHGGGEFWTEDICDITAEFMDRCFKKFCGEDNI